MSGSATPLWRRERRRPRAGWLAASLALTVTALATAAGPAASPPSAPPPAPAGGFDHLKQLVGTWKGEGPDGAVDSTIRLVSNGMALEETFQNQKDNQMVTLYTPDGPRLALTHYCSAGNQPRMATPPVTGREDELRFDFTGGTNLASAEAGHMQALVIHFGDADHFTELWTWRDHGKDMISLFHFTRQKV